MRILISPPGCQRYSREITSKDLLIVNDLVCNSQDLSIYEKLISEMEKCGMNLWQLWHGDSHMITDDKKKWKQYCPTFLMVLDKIRDFFQMDIKATRLNCYRDSNEWKPFHHDAAAIKADKARSQNLTVAVFFGAERDAAFEHAQTKTMISLPQPNGTIYTFGKDVNIIWWHGILQVPPDKYHNNGRISVLHGDELITWLMYFTSGTPKLSVLLPLNSSSSRFFVLSIFEIASLSFLELQVPLFPGYLWLISLISKYNWIAYTTNFSEASFGHQDSDGFG
ncbi:uncharacterized protein LOC136090861 [Hydra vulgaris]|uniref:Uncharacterized protein LOC136090861 n=1 Tax=Hydra vulgaris TaxID=6087 RepID=A0ABM4DHE8_HYDVU